MSVLRRKIVKLNSLQEKGRWQSELRVLWRECFADPKEYEDYYFELVYRDNIVYLLENDEQNTMAEQNTKSGEENCVIGMLHLNPYLCRIEKQTLCLHYIVGVATKTTARRKGVMRNLLCESLKDLYGKKEPFTYLMPADVKYYEPFGFASVNYKQEWEFWTGQQEVFYSNERNHVIYLDYRNLAVHINMDSLLNYIDRWLEANYSGYAIHTRAYFERLVAEKECEQGEVVFCFDEAIGLENLLGFFAYGREEEKIYVEQAVLLENAEWNLSGREKEPYRLAGKEQIKEILQGYFALDLAGLECKKKTLEACESYKRRIHYIADYPFMVRVVDVIHFIKLFEECFIDFIEKQTRLCVVDEMIPQNTGIYRFNKQEHGINVVKQDIDSLEYDVKMTVSELVQFVFEKKKKDLFFAELV